MAEPQNIRDQFNDVVAQGHPRTKRIYLDTLVTGGCEVGARVWAQGLKDGAGVCARD